MRQIAVSDIHGHIQTFERLLYKKVKLQLTDELYILGDYIDRGPGSKQVIDCILELRQAGYSVHCIMGNHEKLMLDARNSLLDAQIWLQNGGEATLRSFGVLNLYEIPPLYWRFLESLAYYIELNTYYLVHAGFDFSKSGAALEQLEAMLWIRKWYRTLDRGFLGKKSIVHGHTPITKDEIKTMLAQQKELPVLDIDCGCYAYWRKGMGRLCAFDLTNKKLYFQKNIDVERIT
ncbi:MAG: serine/threonine protein phosphatase [Sphingobacteriales bacterium]|nr:serine/threonine protein phosphatase [Sphingobacteriales bacterium]